MWPAKTHAAFIVSRGVRGGHGGESAPRPHAPSSRHSPPSARPNLPARLARWLDALDETGRWALIKLVTGGLRIGVSARLAKAAVAALGATDAQDIELLWPGLSPPYVELFAWLEGRAEKPASGDPAPFRPAMLAHALDEPDLAALDPAEFMAEWKWDGIRVQAVAARYDGRTGRAALFAHRRGHFQELSRSSRCAAASRRDRRRTLDHARASRAVVQRAAAAAQSQKRHEQAHGRVSRSSARL